jgi:hypothetical protein
MPWASGRRPCRGRVRGAAHRCTAAHRELGNAGLGRRRRRQRTRCTRLGRVGVIARSAVRRGSAAVGPPGSVSVAAVRFMIHGLLLGFQPHQQAVDHGRDNGTCAAAPLGADTAVLMG